MVINKENDKKLKVDFNKTTKYEPNKNNLTEKEKKEKAKEYYKKYYQLHKNKLINYSRTYKKNNKDIIKINNAIYRENNKEKRNLYMKEFNHPFFCLCGSVVRKKYFRKHTRTKKHKTFISQLF